MTEKEEIYYSDYFQKYFGDLIFPGGKKSIDKDDFIDILCDKEKFAWIFNPTEIRNKIK